MDGAYSNVGSVSITGYYDSAARDYANEQGLPFTSLDTPPTPDAVYGDINLDGSINLADLVTFGKQQRGSIEFNEAQLRNANVYTDDEIDATDMNYLMQFLIGTINGLPVLPTDDTTAE